MVTGAIFVRPQLSVPIKLKRNAKRIACSRVSEQERQISTSLTQQCDADVLTKLNAHDDAANDDTCEQHRTPHPQRYTLVLGNGVKYFLLRSLTGREPLDRLGDTRYHPAKSRVDRHRVTSQLCKACAEQHHCARPNLVFIEWVNECEEIVFITSQYLGEGSLTGSESVLTEMSTSVRLVLIRGTAYMEK